MSSETETIQKPKSEASKAAVATSPEAPSVKTAAVAPAAPASAVASAKPVAAPSPVVAAPAATVSGKLQSAMIDLQSDSSTTRSEAAVELGKLGDRAAAEPLLTAVSDVDADVAREAATALGLLGDPSAIQPLIDVVDNANGYFHTVVRAAAASSLGQLKDVRAVDALLAAVNDSVVEVSAEAIRALAQLGDARAVRPLIDVVQNQSGFFADVSRRAAVLALGHLGGVEASAELARVAADASEDAVIREDATQAVAKAAKTAK